MRHSLLVDAEISEIVDDYDEMYLDFDIVLKDIFVNPYTFEVQVAYIVDCFDEEIWSRFLDFSKQNATRKVRIC